MEYIQLELFPIEPPRKRMSLQYYTSELGAEFTKRCGLPLNTFREFRIASIVGQGNCYTYAELQEVMEPLDAALSTLRHILYIPFHLESLDLCYRQVIDDALFKLEWEDVAPMLDYNILPQGLVIIAPELKVEDLIYNLLEAIYIKLTELYQGTPFKMSPVLKDYCLQVEGEAGGIKNVPHPWLNLNGACNLGSPSR